MESHDRKDCTGCASYTVGAHKRKGIVESSAQTSDHEMVHIIYEAALDNSLWPGLIASMAERVCSKDPVIKNIDDPAALEFDELKTHLERAYEISCKILELEEGSATKSILLDTLSCRFALLTADGDVLREAVSLTGGDDLPAKLPPHYIPPEKAWLKPYRGKLKDLAATGLRSKDIKIWKNQCPGSSTATMLIPQVEAHKLGFCPNVAAVVAEFNIDHTQLISRFSDQYGLTPAEQNMLEEFIESPQLREAAKNAGISYETARSYMKSICAKCDVHTQTDLLKILFLNPTIFLRKNDECDAEPSKIRRCFTTAKGLQSEYCCVGPRDGYPLLFFDSLTGSALDVLGNPARYMPVLETLNMRVITPCRPGTFRSDYRKLSGYEDLASDIEALCQELGIKRFSVLSYSYGSTTALAVAHVMQDKIDRLTMCSTSYTSYTHPNWRELDLFYQIVNVIGRRWPGLLRQIIPFLARSILQNIDRFTNRSARRAKSAHDVAVLMTPEIRERARAMLAERIANGTDGLVQEYRLNAQPLGFDPSEITIPITLIHGALDTINPIGGAELFVKHAPHADLHVLEDMGHHMFFAEWDWILGVACGRPIPNLRSSRRGILTHAEYFASRETKFATCND